MTEPLVDLEKFRGGGDVAFLTLSQFLFQSSSLILNNYIPIVIMNIYIYLLFIHFVDFTQVERCITHTAYIYALLKHFFKPVENAFRYAFPIDLLLD